ncbi:MAG TPA: hypothetical protein VJP45_07295 [Candidatus Limnocylindria bacterium]|nr:hypothetical protein [Candidatus Limnocylindria bacterium]
MSARQLFSTQEPRSAALRDPVEQDAAWSPLYRVGGWSAVVMLALIAVQMAVFFIWPIPGSVEAWFARFNESWLVGLLSMDLLLVVDWVLTLLVFLALVAVVRRDHPAWLTIAVTFELVAAATYFASNGAFELLGLSARFASATTDAERALLLAAGEAVVAAWEGTAFVVATILSAVAILVLSSVLLRTRALGRTIPLLGIVMGIAAIVPPNAGAVGLVFSLVYLLPFVVWLVLVARALLRLTSVLQSTADQRLRGLASGPYVRQEKTLGSTRG